ncbi:hypothetical protein PAL_GLEAN10016860 [Pteropus alecto]|uniref:Uncharacterized protein n=1 Tax=Pteropus alecto TaxID=9402 RepID=L5JVK1_PTEAL|nr:hypothetical protein PAL_GLEAN10016860 [Pteropus alecto]
MFVAHTQGDEPKLLEEDAVLLLGYENWEPGVGFQILGWAHCELPETRTHGRRNTGGKTSMAKVLTVWSPPPPHPRLKYTKRKSAGWVAA